MNKLDRDIRDPMELLDEVENELNISCAPITWPIGCGKEFKGVYHIHRDETILYSTGQGHTIQELRTIKGLDNPELDEQVGSDLAEQLREELELVIGACPEFDQELFLAGELTPVYFGTALGNFGVDHMLDGLTAWAPQPRPRQANEREVTAEEGARAEQAFAGDIIGLHNHGTIQIGDTFTQGEALKFSGIPNFAPELFRRIRLRDPLKQKQLLKGLVQLMDPKHRDRIAFVRIVSGTYTQGMKMNHVRTGKTVSISDPTRSTKAKAITKRSGSAI